MIVKSPSTTYIIKPRAGKPDDRIGATKQYNVYICTIESSPGREYILKVAASREYNGLLDKESFFLKSLQEEAERLEEEYSRRTSGKGFLGYDIGFAELVETFVSKEQGFRRVMILRFHAADELARLVPLRHIRTRDCVRVDPKTSAWIIGKTLKILDFFHSQGVSSGNASGGNILIERDEHLVSFFDLSCAVTHAAGVPKDVVCEEVSQIAKEVFLLLDGNWETGEIPFDEQLAGDKGHTYTGILQSLAFGNYDSASKGLNDFYEIVEKLWGRKFHHYTTYPLN